MINQTLLPVKIRPTTRIKQLWNTIILNKQTVKWYFSDKYENFEVRITIFKFEKKNKTLTVVESY